MKMAVKDPWGFDGSNGEKQLASETDSEPSVSSESTSPNANIHHSFGDNFVDKKQTDNTLHSNREQNQDNSSLSFKPLDDSRQYVDRLELKLQKLQNVSLLKALSERKSDEARRLLDARLQTFDYFSEPTSESHFDSESNIEEPVDDNPMLRKLCPERQAVNLSELEKLLDADTLQKLVEELSSGDSVTEENIENKNHSKDDSNPE